MRCGATRSRLKKIKKCFSSLSPSLKPETLDRGPSNALLRPPVRLLPAAPLCRLHRHPSAPL
ncbi:hypothetical protein QJS10_CPB13g01376 [Acorus calamus]|uniref:Uncharacterized protein n=1 Tax=Acorus calamus TaxID=4465 RepID=A0AAV9DHX1_ACOCL|nr:hypothetical protein QJS10_CPB13g01376 [Acorus calamus]